MTTRQHDPIKTLKVSLINIHFIIESYSNAINKFSGAGDNSINTSTKENMFFFLAEIEVLMFNDVNNRSNWEI
jgi:hypothetical protein